MKEIIILLALVILLISVICTFSARSIVKSRMSIKNENKVVFWLKFASFFCMIFSMIAIYYFR